MLTARKAGTGFVRKRATSTSSSSSGSWPAEQGLSPLQAQIYGAAAAAADLQSGCHGMRWSQSGLTWQQNL